MKFIPFLIFFMSCNPGVWKATEDVVVGEAKIAEEVMADLSEFPSVVK